METSSKLNVAILMGGQSPEHQISLISASNIIKAIDRTKYEPLPVGIDVDGVWYFYSHEDYLDHAGDPKNVKLKQNGDKIKFIPGSPWVWKAGGKKLDIDIVFPVLHGPKGEDGSIQGLLDLCSIPYVGAGILGSAVGMDKVVMKKLLREAQIPIAEFVSIQRHEETPSYEEVKKKLGSPLFIKPANMGSSVGISKVSEEKDFEPAIELAFMYDNKVIIESFVDGREIECAVLGNNSPEASTVGEVIVNNNFYSYESKYIDSDGATTQIPAELSSDIIDRIRDLAVQTYLVLECRGLGRVDVFYTTDGEILINEINTLPGFTNISMYPKLWEASGLSYSDLITELLELALK